VLCSAQEALLLVIVRLQGLLYRERAQTLPEYALMVSLIAVAVTLVALIGFRGEIIQAFNSATPCFDGDC